MAGTQAFEEMEVTEHFWLLSCCCNRSSLKDASMTVTIFGIILGIFILVGGAGGSFFIALLYSAFSNLERTRVSTLQLSAWLPVPLARDGDAPPSPRLLEPDSLSTHRGGLQIKAVPRVWWAPA